jgi:DNA invertase Pin-like site-specific DNA recombinase
MLKERTKLGLARAARVGLGFKLSPAGQKQAMALMNAGKTQTEVAETFDVHRSTISRLVSERRVLERKA